MNQSVESFPQNKKKTTNFKLCEKKFEKNVVQEKV